MPIVVVAFIGIALAIAAGIVLAQGLIKIEAWRTASANRRAI
jgi:hypothetical protein